MNWLIACLVRASSCLAWLSLLEDVVLMGAGDSRLADIDAKGESECRLEGSAIECFGGGSISKGRVVFYFGEEVHELVEVVFKLELAANADGCLPGRDITQVAFFRDGLVIVVEDAAAVEIELLTGGAGGNVGFKSAEVTSSESEEVEISSHAAIEVDNGLLKGTSGIEHSGECFYLIVV